MWLQTDFFFLGPIWLFDHFGLPTPGRLYTLLLLLPLLLKPPLVKPFFPHVFNHDTHVTKGEEEFRPR